MPEGVYSAGTIFLQVVPSYRGLQESIRQKVGEVDKALSADMEDNAQKTGRAVGRVLGEEIAKGAEQGAKKASDKYAGAFRTGIRNAAREAQRELDALNFDNASENTLNEVERIKRAVRSISKESMSPEFDGGRALRDIDQIRQRVRDIGKERPIDEAFNLSRVERTLSGFSKAVDREISKAFDSVDEGVKRSEKAMSKFARDSRSKVRGAIKDLAGDDVFRDVTERLEGLKDINLDVEVDSQGALRELAAIAAAARAIGASSPSIRVQTNAASAASQLAAAGAAGAAASRAGSQADSAANSFRAFNGVLLTATSLGPALVPVLGAVAGGIAAVGVASSGAAMGLGVMLLGFSGISDAVTGLMDVEKNAAKDALQTASTMRTAFQAVADAERSLSRARVDAAQANEDAARNTRRVVRDAAEAQRDAAQETREAVQDAAQANREAAQQIQDAQRQAAQANEDAARRTAAAQRAASEAVRAALQRQEDAEDSLADAQRDARQAQEDLREARRLAQQDLDDIRDRQRQNALDERQAVIDLFNATVAETAIRQDPGSTNLEKEQAAINLGNARERLHEIREEERELARQRREGIEGTDRVQTAQDALTQALERQRDAQEALGEAAREVDQARLEGARAVSEAIRDQNRIAREGARQIAQAEQDAARTRAEGIESVSDARRNEVQVARDGAEAIADARRAQARTEVDGVQSVQDAQRALRRAQQDYQDALKQTGEIGSTSMANLENAMSKLSPAGRRFARYLFHLRGLFYQIRAAAQEGMLPGVQNAMQLIIGRYGRPFTRFVGRMAEVVGGLFEKLGRRMLRGSFVDFFGMLERLGPRFLRQFGWAFINWLEAFAEWAVIIAPYSKRMSDNLLDLSRNALAWIQSAQGTDSWRGFMDYVYRIGPAVADFFWALWEAVKNLAKALAPLGELVLVGVTKFLRFLGRMDPDHLRLIVISILGLVFALQATFAITSGVVSVMTAISLIGAVAFGWVAAAIFVILGLGVALVALYTKSRTARKVIDRVFDGIGRALRFLWDRVIKPFARYTAWVWGHIFGAAEWAWKHILKPTFEAIARVIRWMWENYWKPILSFIIGRWRAVSSAFVWVWRNILWPIIKVIGKIVWELWKLYFRVVFAAIQNGFKALGWGLRWVWRNVLKPLFDAFMDVIGDDLVRAFKAGVDKVKEIWNALKEALKTPVRILIETVMNKGIIGGFNWLASKVGMDKIKPIPLPKGFATGGIYPGYTPGRDIGMIRVSGGEAILRPEATRVLGKRWVDRVNSAAIHGGQAGVERVLHFLGGFARGGVIGNFGRRVWPVPGRDTSTYRGHDGVDINRGSGWDDFGDPIRAAAGGRVSYVGSARGYGNAIFIRGPYGEVVYGHTSAQRVRAGQSVWAGDLIGRVGNSGNSSAPHLHFGFPGGTFAQALAFLRGALFLKEGDGRNWTNTVGDFLAGLGAKVRDALMAPFGWLKDRISDGLENVTDKLGDSWFSKVLVKFPHKLIEGVADWITNQTGDLAEQSTGNFKGPLRARRVIAQALDIMNLPLSLMGTVLARMKQESGFNPNIVNRWDSNWDAGHPSVGLMQVIGPTYDAYKHPKYDVGPYKYGTSVNPLANVLASMRYALRTYGSLPAAYNRAGGYAEGGVVEGGDAVPENGTMMMYDNGGYLPPGFTTVLNLTGGPEPVFTGDQWQAMRNGAMAGAGVHYEPHFNGSDLTAGDVAEDLLFAITRMQRGGVYTGTRG